MAYLKTWWGRLIVLLPASACGVMDLLGGVFSIGPDGTYYRGLLYMPEMIVMYVPQLYTAIKALIYSCQRRHYVRRDSLRVILWFMFFPLVFSVGQIYLAQEIPMLAIGLTISFIIVVQNHQRLLITKDPLTGLNNRSNFIRFIETKMKTAARPLYFLLMDADDFKGINDKFGHAEGDNALILIGKALKTSVPNGFMLARYGGDEFAMVGECSDEREVRSLVDTIRRNLKEANEQGGYPWEAKLSIGYAPLTERIQTVPDFIAAADEQLYLDKKARKAGR